MDEEAQHKIQLQQAQPDTSVQAIIPLPPSEEKGTNNGNTSTTASPPPTTPSPERRGGKSSSSSCTNARSSSRCTRSQAAPLWTVEETLVLLNEIAALDDEWFTALSSYQRWKMISDNCVSMKVNRSSNQCKKRWESLLSDYNKIAIWEASNSASTYGPYWSLKPGRRRQLHLPYSFDQQVFCSVDAVIKAQEVRIASSATDIDSEDLIGLYEEEKSNGGSQGMVEAEASDPDYSISMPEAKCQAEEVISRLEAEMAEADTDLGPEKTGTDTTKNTNKEHEITKKLKENAKEIHAVLRGELPDNVNRGCGLVDLTKPNAAENELTRRQADELIKAFGVLASTLNQFKELIKDGECKEISLMNPMAL